MGISEFRNYVHQAVMLVWIVSGMPMVKMSRVNELAQAFGFSKPSVLKVFMDLHVHIVDDLS